MSAAEVRFHTLHSIDAEAGKEQTFSFNCPKKKGRRCESLVIVGRTSLKHDPQGKNGGIAQWEWRNPGDLASPTFHPSINCYCGWHGFIEAGRCVSVPKTDESEPV